MSENRVSAFLSFEKSDRGFVLKISDLLQTHGISVFVDDRKVLGGHSLVATLQEGIEQCDYMVLFLSPRSIESGWVKQEWHSKMSLDLARGRTVQIIPVLIGKCELPTFLLEFKTIDFVGGYKQVCRSACCLKVTSRQISSRTLVIYTDFCH